MGGVEVTPDPKPVKAKKAPKQLVRKPMSPQRRAAQKANSAKRVHVRTGRDLVCENCGETFYAGPSMSRRRRFCSRRCMGEAARLTRTRTCTVCGETFEHPARHARKTCTPKCANEAKRRAKTGKGNPHWRGGRKPTPEWNATRERKCRCCPKRSADARLFLHHVVYEQHVRRSHGDAYDPRDSLTLCLACHNAHHHNADGRIRVSQLRQENIEFAFELLGAYAADYFTRYYTNDLYDELMARAAETPTRAEIAKEIVGR